MARCFPLRANIPKTGEIQMHQQWLKERHELFIKNIVKDFFECYQFFNRLKENTAKCGIRYEGLDTWVGTEEKKGHLWILKDLCHVLWASGEPDEQDSDGVMLDWMIGAIFHEAMKLKENAYMIEHYRQTFPDKAAAIFNGNGTKVVQEFFEGMTHEAQMSISRMEWLFRHAEKHLLQLMKKERSNPLLVRFLLKVQEAGEDTGNPAVEQGISKLLETLFPEGLDEAYCLAGNSYLEGGWFVEARKSFDKALKIDPSCEKAKKGLRILEKRVKELAQAVGKEFKNNHNGAVSHGGALL